MDSAKPLLSSRASTAPRHLVVPRYTVGGGFSVTDAVGVTVCTDRWCKYGRPGHYSMNTEKPATDDGRPARLCRTFDAVIDDFGTLVEVPA